MSTDTPELGPFNWADPFLFEDQLSDDERLMRDTAARFATELSLIHI